MFNVGGGEILAILVIALIVLGPDKLPNAARQAGKYLNEFRRISSGFQDEIRGAMDLAAQPDPTPVKMEPAEPAEADSAAPDATTAGPDDSGPADPGVASETVAFGDAVAPGTNGSTAGTTAEPAGDPAGDPTVEPATDPIADPAAGSAADVASMTSDPAPSTAIAPSAEVAEAELAVTQAKLAAAQAELAEAQAKLAVARARPAPDPGPAAAAQPSDEAGSVPPDSARA